VDRIIKTKDINYRAKFIRYKEKDVRQKTEDRKCISGNRKGDIRGKLESKRKNPQKSMFIF
jgi:hypothetical protein